MGIIGIAGLMAVAGDSFDTSQMTAEQKEQMASAGAMGAGLGLIMIGLCLISLLLSAGFVCKDSAQTRKLYAVALVLGALPSFAAGVNANAVIGLALRCYWAFEIMKLAKYAEDEQFSK